MRDCILSIFWPRRDILSFFRDRGCTRDDLRLIENFKENGLSRTAMIDTMFDRLSSKPDGGLGQFRAMLKALLEWSHFDPYYFDRLGKLNRQTAISNLDRLRHLQEIRDAKIKEQRQRRVVAQAEGQRAKETLGQLRERFLALYFQTDARQQRGYELERILLELARLFELEVTEPFRCEGEQIDGAIKYDGENYILEAKWQDKTASNEPLYQFAAKVEGKMYGRGIFVSVNGFSLDVVSALITGKAARTILVDAEDLVLVLEEQLTLTEMIDKKVKAAQTRGVIYIHPITEKLKLDHN